MNTPWHDPVVAEIHAVRERLEGQYHGDMAAYSAAAEAHCRKLGLNMAGDPREDSADHHPNHPPTQNS